jgi:hypothetical protein
MYQLEGAMTKCLVCNNSSNREQIPYCEKCGWPMGIAAAMPKHVELHQAILAWASQAYKDNLHLKNIIDSSASTINAQIQDSPENNLVQNSPDLELLTLELASLSNRIKMMEYNYSQKSLEPDANDEKTKTTIQAHTNAIRDIKDFLGKQNSQNQKLDDFKQSSEKALQDLNKEQQRQSGEINILKAAMASHKQPLEISSGASGSIDTSGNELSSGKLATGSLGVSSSALQELSLLKEYNSNSQEVPKSLRDGSKNVAIEDDAVARIQHGNESNITFKPNRSGNFLVISRGGYCYLVPNKQRRIIPQMSMVTKAIYKCNGYTEQYNDFHLIKLAIVSEESIDCWKLIQKGVLEFT